MDNILKETAFKQSHSFEKRVELSTNILKTYPGKVPVIVEKHPNDSTNIPIIARKKFLAPADIQTSKFQAEIRRHMSIPPSTAIYFFVPESNTLINQQQLMEQLYSEYKDADGFLYLHYSGEEYFG
eukprot:TRINITY_DN74119_c0_g1_i1.p2 TRINITY_DN74119_c0_g1~~TRINITY_DN74119_c0_g1_i1.p2  ORF type:complete len:126 (+),score=2.27 TRINITY_DN74119_c0_g1_i1:69-446(+)